MAKKTSFHRLSALDGLRGFAIILVLFNHIPTGFILQFIPAWLFAWIFVNGVTGVTFLFILSGFLMYYIYPNPENGRAFLQKRYTRIFPLFLTMSAIMFTQRQLENASWISLVAILFSYPLVTNFLWTKVIKKLPKLFGSALFLSFFFVQIFSFFLYVFWINKQSFYAFSQLPKFLHEGIVYLINATLTLPFGQYIPMLDGVYWSLASEVLFYILYPIIVIPLIRYLMPKPTKIKILFLISLFFLLGGMHILSYKIFVLSLVQPALFFYFATGITLAYFFKNKHSLFLQLSKMFSGRFYITPFLLAFLTIMTVHDLSFLGQWISPWIRMLFAIPITFCVALILSKDTILHKIFSSRWLIFLGSISYSLYLSHSLVIGLIEKIYFPNNLFTNIMFVLGIFAIACCVAFYLYSMLEAPYFIKDKHILSVRRPGLVTKINGFYIFPLIIVIYLTGIFASYQSKDRFNFFSIAIPISKTAFIQPVLSKNAKEFTLRGSESAQFMFTASENNLGILSLRLFHKRIRNNQEPQSLLFSLTQKGKSQPIVTALYNLDEFNTGQDFPFGFPVVTDAKDKTYIAQFATINPMSKDSIVLESDSGKVVYSANKKELFKNPVKLVQFIWAKMQTAIADSEAQLVSVLLVPFMVIWLVSLRWYKTHVLPKHNARV